jgi:NtrC-family two-component system sensor histidine kinase KinB
MTFRDRGIAALNRLPRFWWLVIGLALVLLVGILDYRTEPEPLVFYLVPILLAARYAGRRSAVAISVASAVVWLAAALLSARVYSHPFLPYASMAMRLVIFVGVALGLSAVQAARRRQREMLQFVVHDLRSPLTNIQTGLLTLQALGGERLEPDEKEVLDLALISSHRMLSFINSLLDIPRLESGRMPVRLMETAPAQLAQSALEQVTLWAGQNGVEIAASLDTGQATVLADPLLTERVLVNLLSNALKVSPPGSVIRLRAAPIRRGALLFSVTDEGPGIAREWRNRVFDRFAQIETPKGLPIVGTGLGLTFCRLAVEAQGGSIWLESEEGKGTTVAFTLPLPVSEARRNSPVVEEKRIAS